jgi:pilus assembly protein CpaF
MEEALRRALYENDEIADLDVAQRRLALRRLALDSAGPDALRCAGRLADEIDGFGVLTALMDDESVTDILVNGPDEVWVDRAGELAPADVTFGDRQRLTRFAQRLVGRAGGRLDRSVPIADARLSDGSRIHVVLPPLAPDGPLVSIRRFPKDRFELEHLVSFAMLTPEQADLLRAVVLDRRTVVISGRTGCGKSTLLDALIRCIPETERIVTIEELPELQSGGEHRVALVARATNVEGRGEVSMRDLVRASLRMRPDRIVVGEVRGAEALDAIDAIATGHPGSMLTVHARSAEATLERLMTLALQAGSAPDQEVIRRQLSDAIDVVVHLDRSGPLRRVSEIRVLS